MEDKSIKDIKSAVENKVKQRSTRRGFLIKALVGTAAVTATAGVAKKTAAYINEADVQNKYLKDVVPGDREMMKREYVEMTRAEKRQLVKQFIEDYKKQS